jgi:hypothetical protein
MKADVTGVEDQLEQQAREIERSGLKMRGMGKQ